MVPLSFLEFADIEAAAEDGAGTLFLIPLADSAAHGELVFAAIMADLAGIRNTCPFYWHCARCQWPENHRGSMD